MFIWNLSNNWKNYHNKPAIIAEANAVGIRLERTIFALALASNLDADQHFTLRN